MEVSHSPLIGIDGIKNKYNDYQCNSNKGIVRQDPMFAKKQWIELMAISNMNNNQNTEHNVPI